MENDRNIGISHWLDLARVAERSGRPMYSGFLSLEEQAALVRAVRVSGISITFWGGYEEAERKIASFCPLFFQEETPLPIVCLKITLKDGKYLSKKIEHRDYLGSILGQGIDRSKVGDILVQEDGAFVFVSEEMAPYLAGTLETIGRAHVTTSYHEGPITSANDGQEMVISLASLRLDALIARGFGMGRDDSAALIRAGRVQLNHMMTTKVDAQVQVGDTISARGKGRIKILEEKGQSKSGRQQVLITRFS